MRDAMCHLLDLGWFRISPMPFVLSTIKELGNDMLSLYIIIANPLICFGHTQPIADPNLILSIRFTKPPLTSNVIELIG